MTRPSSVYARLLLEAMRSPTRSPSRTIRHAHKQYLATIRPISDLLGLETMYFADEIRSADAVEDAPVDAPVDERQLGIAEQLVNSTAAAWDPTRHRDTYYDRVLALIERKAQGEDVVVEREEPETDEVADLMDALRASVHAADERRRGAADAMTATGSSTDLSSLTKNDCMSAPATPTSPAGRR